MGEALREDPRWSGLRLVNLENGADAIRLNAEITVDYDGRIYGGNAFLHETEHKDRFCMGHLDDLGHFDRYWLDMPENAALLEWSYPPEVTANNLEVGRLLASFLRWVRRRAAASDAGAL